MGDEEALPVREGSLVLYVPGIRDDQQSTHCRAIVYDIDESGCVLIMWDDMMRQTSWMKYVRKAVEDGSWVVEVY